MVSTLDQARRAVAAVVDPELPMLTIEDLGVLRDVTLDDGRVVVTLAPTFLGCPAVAAVQAEVARRLAAEGFPDAVVRLSLRPPWTSEDVTDTGRERLRRAGIAPPGETACPACGSSDTVRVAAFGATACRAHHRCSRCAEPFEVFKVHRG